MTPLRKFLVTKTTETIIFAATEDYAKELGERVLSKQKKPEDQLNVIMWPRTVSVEIKEIDENASV